MRHVTPILIIHLALIALLTGCATPTGGDSAGTGPTQASDATSEPGSLDGDLRTRYANGAVAADSKPASEAGVEILKAGGKRRRRRDRHRPHALRDPSVLLRNRWRWIHDHLRRRDR